MWCKSSQSYVRKITNMHACWNQKSLKIEKIVSRYSTISVQEDTAIIVAGESTATGMGSLSLRFFHWHPSSGIQMQENCSDKYLSLRLRSDLGSNRFIRFIRLRKATQVNGRKLYSQIRLTCHRTCTPKLLISYQQGPRTSCSMGFIS